MAFRCLFPVAAVVQALVDGVHYDERGFAEINIAEGLNTTRVTRGMTLDSAQRHLYAMVGGRVS